MPQIVVTVIGNPPTPEQKTTLFSKLSELLVTLLGRTRHLTLVSVTNEPATAWSVGGLEAEGAGVVGIGALIRSVAGSSVDDRARMIRETTVVLQEVLGNPILPLFVVMQEVPPESWGMTARLPPRSERIIPNRADGYGAQNHASI